MKIEGINPRKGKTAGCVNENPHVNKQPAKGQAPPQEPAEVERGLLKHVTSNPISIDNLIAIVGKKAGEIRNTLLLLELKEQISQLPGKTFIRKEQ